MNIASQKIMYFLVMSSRTAFFKLEEIFPECYLNREKSPQIEPLICLREERACHVNYNCMEIIAKRIRLMFDEFLQNADLTVLYFRKRNIEGLGAGVFWRDFREPRVITMNPTAWSKIKQRGNLYQFYPEPSFFLSGKSANPEESTEKEQLLVSE